VAIPAFAQNYPAKPIKILIAQAPGSATDVISRVVANRLSEGLGQPIVIEARPGAGEVTSWFGLLAPAGTPAPIIGRLNAETVKVLARDDVRSNPVTTYEASWT
jgi:tripartite-type tricarboxylate transporter receptor subunit TctC